ncbi:hypothetical protein B5F76_05860 [Desulfovibrio sp. An276]|uniref:hypothetical protein n=1 Tax=Desulfovibrio sp. An276 TaxID=1965618 RepID=UPI000B3AA2DD|nr:hypothetical protein [Desulfovibrio sp. An276]OUO53302.1 hypothetical protein B5F76_05860 [Desulfovibrio sp. An276]
MSETTPLLMKMLDPAWRNDCDYDEGAIKYHSGKHYKALQPSGPHRGGGVRQPDENTTYWEEVILSSTTVARKENIGSIQSIPGTFWFDSHCGVNKDDIPLYLKETGYDWTGVQLGMRAGNDKLQLIISDQRMYFRSDDNPLGEEVWTTDSWKLISLNSLEYDDTSGNGYPKPETGI